MLELHQVAFSYDGSPLLSAVDLFVGSAEWVSILGRSGCGKSTLLKAIAGLKTGVTQQGDIHCHGKLAYMAQQDSLLPWLSVINNVQLANRLHGDNNRTTQQRANELLAQVGLAEHANKAPYELSGGQRQRVALARTLMQTADIVLMDEPFSAVDAITRLELQQLAAQLLADKTVVLITHDPQEAIRLADVIYVMRCGGLSQPFYPEHSRPRFAPELSQPALQQQLLQGLSL